MCVNALSMTDSNPGTISVFFFATVPAFNTHFVLLASIEIFTVFRSLIPKIFIDPIDVDNCRLVGGLSVICTKLSQIKIIFFNGNYLDYQFEEE